MTLAELSPGYQQAAALLRARLRLLRQMLAQETDPEEIWHLKRRIAELTPMLSQMNDLEELTQLQRETLTDYYFHRMTIPEITARRGVHKSTVSRTLHRAENRLRRYLKY